MRTKAFAIFTAVLMLCLGGCAKQEPQPVPEATPAPVLTVEFIDVGQGDAALLECGGHYALIDGGRREDSQRMYTLLHERGIEKLDIVVATHPHEDHIGGLPGALNAATADLVLCNTAEYDSVYFADLQKYALQGGAAWTVPEAGSEYPLGEAVLQVLGLNAGSSENDASLIMKVCFGKTAVLFMADAGVSAESALMEGGADISATVLRVGHHGSDTSTSPAFLQSIGGLELAVISVGEGNTFAHPTAAVLQTLQQNGTSFLRTDKNGTIRLRTDGESCEISFERAATEEELMTSGEYITPSRGEPFTAENGDVINYVVNTGSGKFHYPYCQSVEKISPDHRDERCCTRDELVAEGLAPCGFCHP